MPTSTALSAIAQRPRGRVPLWRNRAAAPVDPELRPAWFAHYAAVVLLAGALAPMLVLLAIVLDGAVEGQVGVFGLKLNAALGLACLACAALLLVRATTPRRMRVATLLASVAALIGVLTLVEHVSGLDLPIDRGHIHAAAGRMGGNSALLLTCLGFGLLFGQLRSRSVRLFSDGLVLVALAFALLGLISHVFAAPAQYPMSAYDPMPLLTALVGIAVCAGSILSRRDRGLGALLSSSSSGGMLARRLIPVMLVAPIVVSRLMFLGVEVGAYDDVFAASMDVLASVAILVAVLVSSARLVDRIDAVRRGNEAQIGQMVRDVARQSEELQRSNRELESFSYSVSHDLRAPIRHIAGFAELLVAHSGSKLDEKASKYLKTILQSAEEAGNLIDELLDFSRLGRAELATRDVDLGEVVRDSWNKLAYERGTREIRFEVGALPHVQADLSMVGVIMTNLLSNAVKYTSRKDAATIEVSARGEGEHVEVTVRDNGVGFDMKYADKLFGVFQRLHGDEFEGVGIGLANVKRIVERHGGRVRAEGTLDGGAAFHFTLPPAKGA